MSKRKRFQAEEALELNAFVITDRDSSDYCEVAYDYTDADDIEAARKRAVAIRIVLNRHQEELF